MTNNWVAMADPEIVREICRSIKQIRINKNISQQEIADTAGLDRTTISRMESGRAVTLLTLVQVLRALDRLDILDVFKSQQDIVSPIKLLKEEEKKRKRAGKSKKAVLKKAEEDSEW